MSKGGHANKDFTPKTMIDFDGKIIDSFSVQEIENIIEPDDDTESGVSYGFIVKTSGFNINNKFTYKTEAKRDEMRQKLKVKLITVGITVM